MHFDRKYEGQFITLDTGKMQIHFDCKYEGQFITFKVLTNLAGKMKLTKPRIFILTEISLSWQFEN
jgi:hypothetical protein